jgi:hypothetical protein
LRQETVGLREIKGEVAQIVPIALEAARRVREQANLQQPPSHAVLGLRSTAVVERALSAAAAERIRAVSSASTA